MKINKLLVHPFFAILSLFIFYLAIETADSAEFNSAITFGPLNDAPMVSTVGTELKFCEKGDLPCLCNEARVARHNLDNLVQGDFIPLTWTIGATDAPNVAYWRLQFYRKMDGDFQDFGSVDSPLLEGDDKNFETHISIAPVVQYFPGMYCIEMYGMTEDLERTTRSDIYIVKF